MVLSPDTLPAHLSSHILLLCTTLPFSTNSVPTLVNSGATDNFINESLAALTSQHLWHLSTPIPLKLFNSNPTFAGDITHYDLQLLVTKLHTSTPIILGFSWLCSINPQIDWSSLTLCLNWDSPINLGPVPFHVSPHSKDPRGTTDAPWTPPQLHSKSAWSFIINIQLDNSPMVLPTLVNSRASGTFVSNQLDLPFNTLDKLLKLQLFDRSPTSIGIIQYHDNTLILDNNLKFQVQLLITQLPESTPIVLGLPWLQDVNPNIDWKNLIMQFPGPKASLAATIPLCLQSFLTSNISDLDSSDSGTTQTPTLLKENQGREESAPLLQPPLSKA
ncbi:hypothetical protein E4T56_gene10786 [Termitomyces sp. T112]|nr:hypothetical protein C0989_002182 [Termitomyces sp. Mn162]KAG5716073.1 hypothetical protein E4T56_gene10786 [Termitomyces sp. T112]